ncbi:hypothetical protein [Cyanobacterium aponinum]
MAIEDLTEITAIIVSMNFVSDQRLMAIEDLTDFPPRIAKRKISVINA